MPRLVDHDERRSALAKAAMEAIARIGIDGVRMRDVAEGASCTPGALPHYFDGKAEILIAALRYVHARMRARVEESIRSSGFDPVELWMCVVPASEEQQLEWKVWLAFAARAAHDPSIAREFRERHGQAQEDTLAVLRTMQHRGELARDAELETVAEHITSTIDGLGLRVTLDPEAWPRERIRAHLAHQLTCLGWRRQ